MADSLHIPLQPIDWDAEDVTAAIGEIVTDALASLDPVHFWPAHPKDDGLPDGTASFYFGATGMIWALDYLRQVGAISVPFDFDPVLPRLIENSRAEFAKRNYSAHGSLLFGDLGSLLLMMRLRPDAVVADQIYDRAEANISLPIRELMWGMPGSMLACLHMHDMTREARWHPLFNAQATRLLSELEDTELGPLWRQDLYGHHHRWLGPVHGYAGNMIPLLRGWSWLEEEQRALVTTVVPQTLTRNAWRTAAGINWPAIAGGTSRLCQHCHGAPGMVTTFADVPLESPELDELLRQGGEFTWNAGPLSKGSNLCHGTGGNGYAFLKLFRRLGDATWLERARSFAMTAIAQCREERSELGRGRYTLWTGDVGLAVYLWDCLTGEPRFPTIDVF